MNGNRSTHRGNFAEGATSNHAVPGTLMGDYAAGQELMPRTDTVQPKGDFAAGQEEGPSNPVLLRGNFARGQETIPRE